MTPTLTAIAVAIAAVVAIAAYAVTRYYKKRDYDYPWGGNKRTDIKYGFYTSVAAQFDETKDFTNLWWSADWEGEGVRLANIVRAAQAGMAVVLDVGNVIFDGTALRANAAERLREFLMSIKDHGALGAVEVIYIRDEINLPEPHNVCSSAALAVSMCRRVAAEVGIDNVKMGMIYYADNDFCGLELFDIVGFDDYGAKANILRPGALYGKMKKRLRPDQRTWLVPGGFIGQDPTSFVQFAHDHQEVWAVIPFVWPADMGVVAQPGQTGIAGLPVREAYVAAGHELTGKN